MARGITITEHSPLVLSVQGTTSLIGRLALLMFGGIWVAVAMFLMDGGKPGSLAETNLPVARAIMLVPGAIIILLGLLARNRRTFFDLEQRELRRSSSFIGPWRYAVQPLPEAFDLRVLPSEGYVVIRWGESQQKPIFSFAQIVVDGKPMADMEPIYQSVRQIADWLNLRGVQARVI